MVSIKYDPAQDLKNWLRIKREYPEDFTITRFYPFNKSIELNEGNFNRILKSVSKEKLEIFTGQARLIERRWSRIEDKVIRRITDYLNIPFKKFNIRVSLTNAYLMPYDFKDKWFMIPTHKKRSEQIRCLTHELFHLYHLHKNSGASIEELEEEVRRFFAKSGM